MCSGIEDNLLPLAAGIALIGSAVLIATGTMAGVNSARVVGLAVLSIAIVGFAMDHHR